MKTILSSISPFALAAILLMSTGCPVGIDYPLGYPGTEKIEKKLIGTWYNDKEDHEMKRIRIGKWDNYSYRIEVLEVGSMYSVEDQNFRGWITKIGGKTFLYAKPDNSEEYYLYCYAMDGKKKMSSWDVSLLVGGVDAVTSTEAFREEVKGSMLMDDFLTEETLWMKE